MIIALMGLRGSGKTTIGQALAERLGVRCVDLDRLTLATMGELSIADAWATRGEPAFRVAEAAVLSDALASGHDMVLALGGGTPTAPGAAERIRDASRGGLARFVYLRADAPTLASRISNSDVNRPSLTGADPVAEVSAVLAMRDELYRSIADVEIDAAQPEDAVVESILRWLEASGSGGE